MFDFDALYQTYATNELIRIVQQPSLYQPEAVSAAERILAERKISPEEYISVSETLVQETAQAAQPGQWQQFKQRFNRGTSFLFTHSEIFDARQWVYLLALGLTFQFLFDVFQSFSYVKHVLVNCRDCRMDVATLTTMFTWVYCPLMIGELVRFKKTGWILAIFYAAIQALGSALPFFFYLKYILHAWPVHLLWIIVYIVVCLLLRKDEIRALFNMSIQLWKGVMAVAVLAFLLFIFLIVF